jgi:RNA-directed DNA polymerase
MNEKQQKIQLQLAFMTGGKAESARPAIEGTESFAAKCEAESPAKIDGTMEEILDPENLRKALKRVKANKGSAGIDRMTIEMLPAYLKQHWPEIREQVRSGTYKPQPVLRVEIPKTDGGIRKLGIPVVIDRFLQQAVMQVLQRKWDPTFSENSYGFRPNRSARQAVAKAQEYLADGHTWIVDIDLEKFLDPASYCPLIHE